MHSLLTSLIHAVTRRDHPGRRHRCAGTPSDSSHPFTGDDRGAAEVVGSILMFGILISALVIVQTTAVPTWNAGVEYEHSLRADADMQALGNAIGITATSGAGPTTTFEHSVTYPTRPFLFNLPSTEGRVELTDPVGVSISNAKIDGVDTVWGGAGVDPEPYENRFFRFDPSYNYFDDAPVYGYEYGVSYREYTNETGDQVFFTANKGAVVDGTQLTLVTITGEIDPSSLREDSIDLYPISAPANPVTISNVEGENVTLTLPTLLDEQTWRTLLADQYDPDGTDPDAYVSSIAFNDGSKYNTMTLTLEPGTYTLRMAKVGVGEPSVEPAHYLTMVNGPSGSARTGETRAVTVEVRDRFNNPVAGVPVTFSLDTENSLFIDESGQFLGAADQTVVTGADGRASLLVRTLDEYTITVGGDLNADGTIQPHEQVSKQQLIERSGVSDGINPYNPDDGLVLTNARELDAERFELTFTNTGTVDQTITEGRLSFYYRASPTNNDPDPPAVGVLNEGTATSTDMFIRGLFKEIPGGGVTIPAGSTGNVTVTFYVDAAKTEPYEKQQSDDWFIFAAIVNGKASTYFVFPGQSLVEQVKPVADAGGPYTTDEGVNQTLDGTASTDNDGAITTWDWTITSDPTGGASLVDADTATPTLVVPDDIDGDATVKLKLTVYDSDGRSDTDSTTVTIRDMDIRNPPTVSMSVTDQSVRGSGSNGYAEFVVDWTASDVDEDLYTVKVELIDTKNGNTVDTTGTLFISGGSASGSATLTDSQDEHEFRIKVTVTDSKGNVVSISEIHNSDGDEEGGNYGSTYP